LSRGQGEEQGRSHKHRKGKEMGWKTYGEEAKVTPVKIQRPIWEEGAKIIIWDQSQQKVKRYQGSGIKEA